MKKYFLFTFILIFVFSFCKKNSTDGNGGSREDKITVEIYVSESGSPKSAIYVELTATIGESVRDEGAVNWDTQRLPSSQTDDGVTNQYGIASFIFNDKSLADDTIVVTRVRLFRSGSVIHDDAVEKVVQRNTTRRFEYEL